jgi:hypothetical protein
MRDDEHEQWELDAAPTLLRLMATLQSARLAASLGPTAMGWATDQIRAGLQDGEQWISHHPCPQAEMDDRIWRTLRTYRIVERLFELESLGGSGPNLRVITSEIDGLIATIANTFAADSDQFTR